MTELFSPLIVPGHSMTLDRLGNKPLEHVAQYWFEVTRGSSAFCIPKHGPAAPMGYTRKRGNAFSWWYDFSDGSRLSIGRANKQERGRNEMTCGPSGATMKQSRTLWDAGGSFLAR